jgi:hypothetical protein
MKQRCDGRHEDAEEVGSRVGGGYIGKVSVNDGGGLGGRRAKAMKKSATQRTVYDGDGTEVT